MPPSLRRRARPSSMQLVRHCRSDRYLRSTIAAGGPRYALDGAQSGEVAQSLVLVLARRSEKAVKPPIPKVVSRSPVLRLARRRA
jgi:sRNA-binding protein